MQLLSVNEDDAPNPWGRVPTVQTVSPSIRHELVWFAGRPVAQLAPGQPLRFTFTDHLGTPILQTATDTTILWHAEHEPFGV